MVEPLLKIWLVWIPFAFVILAFVKREDYDPFRTRWGFLPSAAISAIGWPIYYTLALFHERRG